MIDSQPRLISNLIVDQTSTNPAAVAAAAFPVRSQNNPGSFACTTDPDLLSDPQVAGIPAGCVPSGQTLDIPNITTDVGLSPPYNALFTYFGQFFDHGIDQTVKGGGTVFVPLRADDPLIAGPDKKVGTGDDLPRSMRFMVLTRAKNQPGPDGVLGTDDDATDALNTDSPWIDQSQTYSSHASHQAFLREYAMVAGPDGVSDTTDDRPVSTGKLLGGLAADETYPGSPDGRTGMSTWAAVKAQAAARMGLLLTDADVTHVPMLAMDPYGNFIAGAHGLPQYVTSGSGLVEGDLAAPTPVPSDVRYFDTPFLTDIAHNADPSPVDSDRNPSTPPVAPRPDGDTTASADFAAQPAGTYDDEMLDAHFACGDGRCNENIALSAIHQVFHSEHDRLVDELKQVLTRDTSATGQAALTQWKLAATESPDGWNGSRLFQAARFVTEMEYQHAVFEDFGRKVQPAIRAFRVYSPDLQPAVDAEFAHAVYRFGHSMLNDTVARTNVSTSGAKTDNSLSLLSAFLNPPAYYDGGAAGTLTPAQAAGSIMMGSSDQIGNELDEFVTETLRNNLLGLPLDLATLNLARARDAGVPPLNEFRRQLANQTNDGQLAPYASWSDFGQHLRHPESLINFVAAYGTHPTVRDSGPDGVPGTPDDVTTAAAKRTAARLIVDPANSADPAVPTDAADFMFSTGTWAGLENGVTTTGLDDVDLWVGGLAEVTNLFGGLLGTTFNFVFQTQMEKLQDGDRLYYLARTPGMNLRAQLEGNSFAELVQRNTDDTDSLKADAFAVADCRFQLGNLTSPAASGSFITGAGSINDDLSTPDCNENRLLQKSPNGTIAYRTTNSVDPSGINGQSVYNGTALVDRINGGNDNDTFWGGPGNDVIEGNGGDDVALGGEGNDILTDLGGDDFSKGGPGNDAVDAGIGFDIVLGGDGQDVLNGGSGDNQVFGGPDNDFIIGGTGADAVFGDGGDDWIQGGTGQDLLQGDHGAPFFDDPAQSAPGNDIFIGQPGENDYDGEGGDDLMSQNAAIDRNAGAGGFDWAFHQYDTTPADDDLEINNNLAGLALQIVTNRDRWQETEAVSGGPLDDVIKGTSIAPKTLGGGGFTGCDAIDAAGVARIKNLDQLITSFPSDLAPIIAASAPGACPLEGPTVWGEGDVLIGGAGSDTFTGRGADDIIDGDRFLQVRISVRTDPADPNSEIGTTDLIEGRALSGNFGPGTTANTTLQQAVFAGLVDPGRLVATRTILTAPALPADCGAAAPKNCDTAVFQGPSDNYSIAPGAVPGQVLVSQIGANLPGQRSHDGIDTLTNIEQLQFTDRSLVLTLPATPTVGAATFTTDGIVGTANLEFTSTAVEPP
ncbi:MAG: peroxidase family protein, partial [Nakamurella sp.]